MFKCVGIWVFTTALEIFFLEMEIFFIIQMISLKFFLFVACSLHLQQHSHPLPNV